MWAGRRKTVTDIVAGAGPLYERLWQPLMLAALNTDPHEGSARLAGAVMRNTLAKGGAACRPFVAEGLSAAFIEPALAYLGDTWWGNCIREAPSRDRVCFRPRPQSQV